MTQPQPEPEVLPEIAAQAGVAPGPGGVPWVVLTFRHGLAQFGLMMPDDAADRLGPVLATMLAEAASQARRQRLGIVVPTLPLPPVLRPLNGSGRGGG
jgi:hypothetical protein